MNEYLVLIPTYNEAESIGILLNQLSELPVDVLVIDDASPDGTAEICRATKLKTNEISVLVRQGRRGMGSAYVEGYTEALKRNYRFIIQMDADGSHRVDDLLKMMKTIESNSLVDLLIGSRWIKGGAVQNWSRARELLSRGANAYSKICLKSPIDDLTAGFRIYRTSLLERMNLRGIESQGYSFQIEMSREAIRQGAQVLEVPILFVERTHGVSKMTWKIILEAMLKVTAWGLLRKSNSGRGGSNSDPTR
ncbi:MAG: polyprenol monophosphomannose synthase [Actinobacteria bacterium]|nr:polyprenol monophosphomannose synthase [Actinomycetota bacterium]